MAHASLIMPFDDYLHDGITAADALRLLEEHDGLSFPQLQSGLFPAVNFDDRNRDATGMADAWLRDSSCIGLALLRSGREGEAKKALNGVIESLVSIEERFKEIIQLGYAPDEDSLRPPVRFTGEQSSPQYEWANAQNDALGYALLFIGEGVQKGLIAETESLRTLLRLLVDYLTTITYWKDEDSGHWEEVRRLNASSVGTVISGLRAVRGIVGDTVKIEALIARGNGALEALLPLESKAPHVREIDASHVFLVEPQHLLTGEQAQQTIHRVEEKLKGELGVCRYRGDSYWAPDYRMHFQLGSRALDFSNPNSMELRDRYLTPGNEAQWTLFDPMIALYYTHRYEVSKSSQDAARANEAMVRSLLQFVAHGKADGTVAWRLPELFFQEDGEWVPNDHLGLLWAQANVLLALTEFKRVFGDTLLRIPV